MSEEKITPEESSKFSSRPSRSVFAPMILIAAGVFFLLDNLNILPPLNWSLAFRFWPLLLIMLGLNVLVVQIRRPWGTLLSLLVVLVTLGIFGYLLLSESGAPLIDRLGLSTNYADVNEESFAVGLEGTESAEMTLDLGNYPVQLTNLNDTENLISGTVWSTRGVLVEPQSDAEGQVNVTVKEESGSDWILDPSEWLTGDYTWEIGISPEVPVELTINAGNGSVDAWLASLLLTRLSVNGGNGGFDASFPGGNYDISVDGGNGRLSIELPDKGRQEMELEGGNGSITLTLSPDMEAQLQFDEGSGNVSVDGRFELVRGDGDEGVYQTEGYEDAPNRILIIAQTGNGRLTIREP